ncbi:MAG: hypothetical protein KBH94_01530 [Caldisericia bacterium]|nr:hypothetical protein [Caldisericia bacterium]HOV29600.1 hypothetical protein [Candidatus Dojkabacteria bacterium]
MNIVKYWIYPIVLILFLLIFSFLNLNGSSVGMYNIPLSKSISDDPNVLIGTPRAIRSDQYLVVIPTIVSQDINNEKVVNTDMGEGANLGTQNLPSRNFFAIFRPSYVPFYFSNDTNFTYSFAWWADFVLLLVSTYLLLLVITKKNLFLSIIGSLIFLFVPFFQWWNQVTMITWLSFGIFFFLKVLTSDTKLKAVLYGLGLSYSIVAFALLLYPPFQVAMAYIAIAIAVGFVISDWKNIKKRLKTLIPVLVSAVILSLAILVLYYLQFEDVINITMNTVYPGTRFISAGGGDFNQLFDGFYNILLQKDSNSAPFGNQSESSNFFLLFPPIIIWVIYKNIQLKKSNKKMDWIAICLSFVIMFFMIWLFVPLPDFISKYSFLYLIPPTRSFIGLGYGSYILMFYVLSRHKIYKSNGSLVDKVMIAVLSLGYGFLTFKVGKNLYNISPDFFRSPTLVSFNGKILLATVFSVCLVYLLLKGFPKVFMIAFLCFSLASTAFINPLYKGLDILINTDLAKYIREVSEQDDSKWIAYDNNYLAQYALANNASIINGIHFYPQFKIWNVLDEDGKYMDVYNRYAHINISEYEDGEEYIRLLYPDALEINISPCNEKWQELNVKYIITYKDLSSYSCVKLKKDFPLYGIKIYDRE